MTAATQKEAYGLVPGHAYTLLGCYELKDSSGRVVERLMHLRNPWANETYTGPWNDSSRNWTEDFKRQVPYAASNEGQFFIALSDYQKGFPITTITYVTDDYVYSYLGKEGAQSTSSTFDFQATMAGEAYISLDFYNDRQYPYGCSGETSATLTLAKDGRAVA